MYIICIRSDNMQFGEKLKELREKNNLTQTAVAKELGVTQRAISYYENNNVVPNDPTALNKLAKLFDVTLDELLLKNEGPKSKLHLLVEKLIIDTKNKLLTWESFETAYYEYVHENGYHEDGYYKDKFITVEFPQYSNYTYLNKESFFAAYRDGGYLIAKIVSPEEDVDIALFVLFNDKYSFIANKDSIKQIDELYLILSNVASGVNTFIDDYLNDDMKPKKNNNTVGSDLPTDEELPF